jgi:hypothetical protein
VDGLGTLLGGVSCVTPAVEGCGTQAAA